VGICEFQIFTGYYLLADLNIFFHYFSLGKKQIYQASYISMPTPENQKPRSSFSFENYTYQKPLSNIYEANDKSPRYVAVFKVSNITYLTLPARTLLTIFFHQSLSSIARPNSSLVKLASEHI